MADLVRRQVVEGTSSPMLYQGQINVVRALKALVFDLLIGVIRRKYPCKNFDAADVMVRAPLTALGRCPCSPFNIVMMLII